jgi:hypothetical protein
MQSIITDSTITLIAETGPSVIGKSHPNFYKIKKALLAKNFLEVEEMLDVKNGYKEFSNGLIAVDGDNLIYNGTIVHNVLTQRIVQMIHNGDEATPMLNFLVNLMDNPSEGSIDQLYTFLEHENLPITEDGCFLAYKAINRNYTDKYSGTISNKVGEKVKMPYEEVTADPTKHCSSGLHCGSIEYVRCYGNFTTDENGEHTGDRLVTVKVNPSAVVSVPEDSDRQKVRVYRYVVHEEIENPFDLVPKYEAPVYYDSEGNVYDEEDYDDYESWSDDDEYSWDTHGECEDEEGHDDSNLYSELGHEGLEGKPSEYDTTTSLHDLLDEELFNEPGNPIDGLIDFDDPQRSESTLAGMVRQSTDNPLKKNSFDDSDGQTERRDPYDIDGNIDIDMINAIYNNADYATGQPSEKISFDSRSNMHHKAREIFEYYESTYGKHISDCVALDNLIKDLKNAGFDMQGRPLEESPDQKNFLDSIESDKSELPECPKEIVLEKNPVDATEETTIDTLITGNDGIIMPNTNNNN